jgi:hypothetical protein
MSKGAGVVERRIADLLAATRDRALSVEDIADHAFALKGARPTRAQRLSATRAAHRLLKRCRDDHERADKLVGQAHARTKVALGFEDDGRDRAQHGAYRARLEADRDFIEGMKLHDRVAKVGSWYRWLPVDRLGFIRGEHDAWCAETVNRRLYLHPPDVPVRVWAVSLGRGGITWSEAAVLKVTARNVMVRYAGKAARLNREKLWYRWAWWRGVQFVSSRTGRIAAKLDDLWWRRYGASGATPPSMQVPLAEAMTLLGVPADYTKDDVERGFRRAVKLAHPDVGGTAEQFRKLVEARDRLLSALGTSAPAPKPPRYAPAGIAVRYTTVRTSRLRLGGGLRRLA